MSSTARVRGSPAVVNQTDQPRLWRVTVVTGDRPGLLAATSATLAGAGLSIADAAVTVLPRNRLAMQRLTVASPRRADTRRRMEPAGSSTSGQPGRGGIAGVGLHPRDPVVVEAHPQELGRTVVTIEAPDGVGLLHAAAAWFEAAGCNVEACRAGTEGGRARDVFIVTGQVDTAALASALSGPAAGSIVTRVATTPLHVAIDVVGVLLRTGCATGAGLVRMTRRRADRLAPLVPGSLSPPSCPDEPQESRTAVR